MEVKRYINIKVPKGSRKTFALIYDIRSEEGRRFEQVQDERINSINERFVSNELTISEAKTEIYKIKLSLLPKKQIHEINQNKTNQIAVQKLLNSFEADRKQESQEAIELDYRRILKILGTDSISTIQIAELKKRIITSHYSDSIKNRIIIFTNKLLKFVGRSIKLASLNVEIETRYLTEEELDLIIPNLEEVEQALSRVFFYTGLRLGELFAIKRNKYDTKKSEYKVTLQLKEDLYYDTPKRLSIRTIKIPRNVIDDFQLISSLPEKELFILRNKISKSLLSASRKTFNSEDKHISAQDLRHSFGMNSLRRGINISQIAKMLGNSVAVCEKHYTAGINHSSFLDEFEEKLLNRKTA